MFNPQSSQNALVFIGGDAPAFNILSWENELIIAADAGIYTVAKWGVAPLAIVGDFDSVSPEDARTLFPQAKQLQARSDKDDTDTELAIQYALQHGAENISCIGGTGGRLDHFIALLFLFKRYENFRRIIDANYQIEKITSHKKIDCSKIADKYISFFPISETCRQRSSGLKWELSAVELSKEKTSISNEHTSDFVEISMQEGELLGIWAHGNAPQHFDL